MSRSSPDRVKISHVCLCPVPVGVDGNGSNMGLFTLFVPATFILNTAFKAGAPKCQASGPNFKARLCTAGNLTLCNSHQMRSRNQGAAGYPEHIRYVKFVSTTTEAHNACSAQAAPFTGTPFQHQDVIIPESQVIGP